jgi:hypothetical protein
MQQMDAQALQDLYTRLDAKDDVNHGRGACAGKERPPMTEQNQARDLLERTRDGVAEIASQAAHLRAGVAALGELRQREDASVGIEMFVDAAVDLLEAFRKLASGILNVQAEVDTLAAEMADDDTGREACAGEDVAGG